MQIAQLIKSGELNATITINGWVRTFRSNRFIALSDGSTIKTIQCVVDFDTTDPELIKRITTGAAVKITGKLVESLGKGQSVEIVVENITILGDANPEEYPLQPKKHSLEFLRENAHLRPRTNTFGAILRVRHHLSCIRQSLLVLMLKVQARCFVLPHTI
jgi:asparaginyl-tRNA synthetase